MNRKLLYGALAFPIIAFLIFLAVLPSATRATFLFEFKHRTALLFGYSPEPLPEGEKGLRSEHPEEYGPQPGAESESDEDKDAEPAAETQKPAPSENDDQAGVERFSPKSIFAQRDQNQDGMLTTDELGERPELLLANLDTDGDGQISFDELKNGLQASK